VQSTLIISFDRDLLWNCEGWAMEVHIISARCMDVCVCVCFKW
jgi:hypothetical protein